ncbi:MAG: hypothetical protein JNL11_10815 [Bdellovibrionaceae bacterium]|nr:hypothetical protein [Pseudobdellovibrionaceae bacterium]
MTQPNAREIAEEIIRTTHREREGIVARAYLELFPRYESEHRFYEKQIELQSKEITKLKEEIEKLKSKDEVSG